MAALGYAMGVYGLVDEESSEYGEGTTVTAGQVESVVRDVTEQLGRLTSRFTTLAATSPRPEASRNRTTPFLSVQGVVHIQLSYGC